jgi:hypothetical protein
MELFVLLYLNADPTSDWTTADTGSFDHLTETALGASFDDQLSETCLMTFLSDFRSTHHEVAPRAEGSEVPRSSYRQAAPQEPAAFIDDPYVGSPEKVGEDWWLASDGRWYAPELHPDLQMEVTCQPAGPEPDGHEEDAHPDMAGPKARRPRLRSLRRSPTAVQ